MKIAIILPSFLPVPAVNGGAVETLAQMFIEQNEKVGNNLNITVFSPYERKAEILSGKFTKTKFVWIKSQSISFICLNFIIRVLRRVLKLNINHLDIQIILKDIIKGNFDKVVIEGNTRHVLVLSKYINKEKLFFHVHANIINTPNETNDKIVDAVNKIITVSQFIKNMVLKNTKSLGDHINVLRNCTDTHLFNKHLYIDKRSSLRNKYEIKDEDVVIFFSGRIVREKGIIELFQALKLLPQNMKFKLIVAGSFGSNFGYKDEKTILAEELKEISMDFRDKIVYTGYIPGTEMPLLYTISDIVVTPSICEEAAGLVAIEAMSSGLPLIATNSGGLPEYVNEKCAIIINRDVNLVKNLALSLEKLIMDRELREVMGEIGRKHTQQFSIENYFNNLLEIINI